MQTVPRRKGAGLDAELGQCIRKREGHVHVREAVVVVAAVQQIVRGVPGAAGDGDGLGAEEALTAGVGSIAVIDGSPEIVMSCVGSRPLSGKSTMRC